jgi:RNA polymerase sigma-70 factor (ECF subfamily)
MAEERAPRLAVVLPLRTGDPLRAMTDAELVPLVRARDVSAVRELYRRYAKDAERMLVRIAGFAPERADLLQDVFVRVLEGIDRVRDPSALRSWVCGIAVRRAQEHRRERRRAPSSLEIDPPTEAHDPSVPHELVRVYALLDRLDEDDRVAFVLRRIDGMELQEIATACEVSLPTVKRRIARAEEAFLAMAERDPFLSGRLDRRQR